MKINVFGAAIAFSILACTSGVALAELPAKGELVQIWTRKNNLGADFKPGAQFKYGEERTTCSYAVNKGRIAPELFKFYWGKKKIWYAEGGSKTGSSGAEFKTFMNTACS